MDSKNSIQAKGLYKYVEQTHGQLSILENINLTVSPGSALAIVGHSGSGKSTLLGLLAGLDLPSSGSIYWGTHNICTLTEDERAKWRAANVGFVFQSFQLLPHLNALENVMLPLELAGQSARDLAVDMLNRVGLQDRLDHYPHTLSGGEQQRVGLARAFVKKPVLLFADEPTGSLDAATSQNVIDLMFELQQEHRSTLLLVTHDTQLSLKCDQQWTLCKGRSI